MLDHLSIVFVHSSSSLHPRSSKLGVPSTSGSRELFVDMNGDKEPGMVTRGGERSKILSVNVVFMAWHRSELISVWSAAASEEMGREAQECMCKGYTNS